MKIGIDLGGSHIAIGLVNDQYEITDQKVYYITEDKKKDIQNYIVNSIAEGINELLYKKQLTLKDMGKIGIAVPGNAENGVIKKLVNLGIENFEIVNKLRLELKDEEIEIKIQNDGKCAAMAEKEFGSLKQYENCVFLCIGTGVGGAAFLNNQILNSKRNSEFEIGHMIINKGGPKCNCGNNGCFEVYCSKKKFKRKMCEILNIDRHIDSKDFIKEVNNNLGNQDAAQLLENYIDDLAIGISNIINILEPEAISIGGSLSSYEDLIFDKLREKIDKGIYLYNKENPPKILAAEAGNDAGIVGATLL